MALKVPPQMAQLNQGQTSAMLFATWLACGLNCRAVRLICEAGGLSSDDTRAIVNAFAAAGGNRGV